MQGDKLAPMTGQTPADRIEALEAALAMAREALEENGHRIWEHHEAGYIRAQAQHFGSCLICEKESPDIFERNKAALVMRGLALRFLARADELEGA